MCAITGITGKVGGIVARTLLAAGLPVRAVVRDADKGRPWADRGCEVAIASISDAAGLTNAFFSRLGNRHLDLFQKMQEVASIALAGGDADLLQKLEVVGGDRMQPLVTSIDQIGFNLLDEFGNGDRRHGASTPVRRATR